MTVSKETSFTLMAILGRSSAQELRDFMPYLEKEDDA
jgi:hypothetical protein